MSRTIFLIDGFNLYHALADNVRYRKYRWLSLSSLARKYITTRDSIEDIYYFTALAFWNPDKVRRHRIFIRAQEYEGVKVIYGEFKRKDKFCNLCRRTFTTFEEKQTDVNIALTLFRLAMEDKYDKAIVVSGDTDLAPSIREVRSVFPSKPIGVVIPMARRSDYLKRVANFHHKMKEQHLRTSLLNDPFTAPDGTVLNCPPNWK